MKCSYKHRSPRSQPVNCRNQHQNHVVDFDQISHYDTINRAAAIDVFESSYAFILGKAGFARFISRVCVLKFD